jgi:MFS family permease
VSETLPLFYVGTAIAYLALAVPIGRLADRIGRARIYMGGHVIVAAVYAVMLATNLGTAGVVVCLALTDGVLAALTTSVVPLEVYGSGLGMVGTATSLARLVGSILVGALWSWRGPSAVLLFSAVGTIVVIAWSARSLLRLDARPAESA